MSKLKIKENRAKKKGHFPYKLDGQWFIVYSEGFGDIYGPFKSKREAINTAYHNSLQKNLALTVEVN